MLSTLRIKNLALVADLTLDLRPGFNAITGETGAGKSIIIGALNLVLGERADRTLIRAGEESCSVEAVFDLKGLKTPLPGILDECGLEPCADHQLMLKRVFTAAGTNRQFVNGSPATLAVLGRIGQWLVDMHGPHDHQSLLQPVQQLEVLDAFGKLEPAREAFAALAAQRTALMEEKAALVMDERTYAQQLDLLRFQVHEIADARLQPEEETQVEAEHQRVSNAARLLQLAQQALGILDEGEANLMTQAGGLGRIVHELNKIDSTTNELVTTHEQAVNALEELRDGLSRYADRVELDPARLQELEERLNLIHSLKRKYGATVSDVIAFGEEARKKLASLEQREGELTRLQTEIARVENAIWRSGTELSARRRKLIPQLCKAVIKQLSDLGFKQSKFGVSLQTTRPEDFTGKTAEFATHGIDTVEFQFAPNPGEPERPLRAIASSGEMARVMLALKTVLANEDRIPVLVFDEVDANIGGETARTVGLKMGQIGAKHQVLCITHLAPVAAAATAHYRVSKDSRDGRTFSHITLLDKSERVDELTRMLGGASAAARKHAEELLKAGAV
jgi:DNA repair protein RecN (Recombination protein N)